MSASYNQPFLFGTNAERLAYIVAHPGSNPGEASALGGLRWFETDTGAEYIWDWTAAAWVQSAPVGAGSAPDDAQYLTLALDAGLSAERVLTAGEGIDFADTGANGTLTISGEDATDANKGIASFSVDHFSVAAGAVSLAADGIDDLLIDWGFLGNQVSAADVPIADAGNYYAGNEVESALQEQGGIDPAPHDHSKLVASDGTPDPAWSVDAAGNLAAAAGLILDLNGNADALVLDADADTSISAPTDDQIDFEVGNADEGHWTVSGLSAQNFAFRVKNTSGGAATANDLGYIDEGGEYKTTTTAYSNVAWCVVVKGGANNADIYVARRGRVTVTLNGNCSAGDYLYTSTTAGQAQPQSYFRAEAFAVALTANAGGAGGTCSALLLTGTTLVIAPAGNVYGVASHSDFDFVATIAGLPGGADLTYNAPTSGAEDTIVPAATYNYKLRLHNTTRGTSALITAVNAGTNTITLTANVPGDWQVGDTITARSQTYTDTIDGLYGYDISLNDTVDTLARALLLNAEKSDSGGGGEILLINPYQATLTSDTFRNTATGATLYSGYKYHVKIINGHFVLVAGASGASTANFYLRQTGYFIAVP